MFLFILIIFYLILYQQNTATTTAATASATVDMTEENMDVVIPVVHVEKSIESLTPLLPIAAPPAVAPAGAPAAAVITVAVSAEKTPSEVEKNIITNIVPKKGIINPFSSLNATAASNTTSIFGTLATAPAVSTGTSTVFPVSTVPTGIFGLKSNISPPGGIPGIRTGTGIGIGSEIGTVIPVFGAQTGSASSFAQRRINLSGMGVNKNMIGSTQPIEVVKDTEIGKKRSLDPSVEEILDFVDCDGQGDIEIERDIEVEEGGVAADRTNIKAAPVVNPVNPFAPSVPLSFNSTTTVSSGFGNLIGATPTFGFGNAGGDAALKGPFSSFRSSTPTSATGSSFTAVKPFFLGTSTAPPVVWPQSTGNVTVIPAVKFGSAPVPISSVAVPAVAVVAATISSNIETGSTATTSTSSLPSSSIFVPSVATSQLESEKSNTIISLSEEPEQGQIQEHLPAESDLVMDTIQAESEVPHSATLEAPVQPDVSVSTSAVVRKPKTKPAHLLAANAKYAPVSDNTHV